MGKKNSSLIIVFLYLLISINLASSYSKADVSEALGLRKIDSEAIEKALTNSYSTIISSIASFHGVTYGISTTSPFPPQFGCRHWLFQNLRLAQKAPSCADIPEPDRSSTVAGCLCFHSSLSSIPLESRKPPQPDGNNRVCLPKGSPHSNFLHETNSFALLI